MITMTHGNCIPRARSLLMLRKIYQNLFIVINKGQNAALATKQAPLSALAVSRCCTKSTNPRWRLRTHAFLPLQA
jgi:hypothetical protein